MNALDQIFRGVAMLLADATNGRSYVISENGVSVGQVAGLPLATGDRLAEIRRVANPDDDHDGGWDEYDQADADYWDLEYPGLLRRAAGFWAAPDMCTVIDHAGHFLPETHVARFTQCPTPLGVVTFGVPLQLGDEDDTIVVDALYWHATPSGVIVRWLDYGRETHRIVPCTSAFEWGRVNSEVFAVLVAFWLFIAQRVPALSSRIAPRHLRRHALADAPLLQVATVATLRRRAPSPPADADGGDVAWTHRWLVSGHWREQYHPSTDSHETIWIAPYVKGPDQLPLITKDRAFAVVR